MKKYVVEITDEALSDMEQLYNHMALKLLAPENALGQYNRIADQILKLDAFPERFKIGDSELEQSKEIRKMLVDNYSELTAVHVADIWRERLRSYLGRSCRWAKAGYQTRGMPMALLSEWLGHAQISTTLHYYANADTKMKKEAIEKATSKLNQLVAGDTAPIEWENDEEVIRRLYGLSS